MCFRQSRGEHRAGWWVVSVVGALIALAGASGCSGGLGVETMTIRPGGSSGGGSTGGSGPGGAGGGADCPSGTVRLGGQCCAPPAAGGACNLPACGCASGDVCYTDEPETGLQCFPGKNVALGQSCTTSNTCAAGAGCFSGVCKAYCQADADCPAINGLRYCRPTNWSGTSTNIPGVNVCAVMCDPVQPQSPRAPLAACPAGARCAFANDSRYSDCAPGGTATAGQPCPNGNECSPGHYCATRGVCYKACGSTADCPMGEGCLDFSTAVSLNGMRVGYCGNCDPAHPEAARTGLSGCATGWTCGLVTGRVYQCLRATGMGDAGAPCPGVHSDCKPGHFCTAATNGVCRGYCTEDADCGGAPCTLFPTNQLPGGQTLGYCPLPAAPAAMTGG